MARKIKLFCLPYAGGSASIYNQWKPRLADNIQLYSVELAGRGSRIGDDYYSSLDEAVEDVFGIIKNHLLDGDYAIFGHSMGALIAYEVLQKIKLLGLNPPVHAFFSGRNAPNIERRERIYSSMDAEEFEEEILALGGTPPELFRHPELKKIFVPLLRSDFKIAETFVDRPEINPLPSDISILMGEDEEVTPEDVNQWNLHSSKKCEINYIKGGHFFLHAQQARVIDIINKKLVP